MYEINPPAVYIHERALATPERKARVERMLRHVDCRPETVDDERLNEISLGNEWHQRLAWRTGQWQQTGDPVLI
ncbi:MAG TPA: hypothetical protein QGH10_09535, partial [Armatimonadota bacterium]|nr:hypothetical protein [Armatimonadota bacterium]